MREGRPVCRFEGPKRSFGRPKRHFGRQKRRFGYPKRRFGRPTWRFGRPKRCFGRPKRCFGRKKIFFNLVYFLIVVWGYLIPVTNKKVREGRMDNILDFGNCKNLEDKLHLGTKLIHLN